MDASTPVSEKSSRPATLKLSQPRSHCTVDGIIVASQTNDSSSTVRVTDENRPCPAQGGTGARAKRATASSSGSRINITRQPPAFGAGITTSPSAPLPLRQNASHHEGLQMNNGRHVVAQRMWGSGHDQSERAEPRRRAQVTSGRHALLRRRARLHPTGKTRCQDAPRRRTFAAKAPHEVDTRQSLPLP
jgi:hypothetical protein